MTENALQRRVRRLEVAEPGRPDAHQRAQRQALRELYRHLRERLPDPAGNLQPVADLAERVTAGRATDADRALLTALPAAPLTVLGIDADEFMAMLHVVEAGC